MNMKTALRNTWVGLLVLAAIATLIVALYLIGSKQNLFGNTFRIGARFYNVNGLTKGNNVRFAGIDVGSVESVAVVNDSSVYVVLIIENKIHPFIRNNAVASVGTDGLMGNKLVNINPGSSEAPVVQEGQMLKTLRPLEMDAMARTLDLTNQNLEVITSNLRHITDKINGRNSLWTLLMDTIVANNIKVSFANIKTMSSGGVRVIGKLEGATDKINRNEGVLGALISDKAMASKLTSAISSFKDAGDTLKILSGNISAMTRRLNNGEGSAGKLLNDTVFAYNLNDGLVSVKKAAAGFDENMKALHSSWPFRKYYKRQSKSTK
jgi:phospholipid/cholesterol/gamma-HCH transport system substrate-binding protein